MRKSQLTTGSPIFVMKIEMFVTHGRFCLALLDYIYRNGNEEIIDTLKKKQAIGILKEELFHYGRNGEYHDGMFEGSFELGEERNRLEKICSEWVKKNYPYLSAVAKKI